MLISQGAYCYVYDIDNGIIKNISKDKHGIWQNESEIRIYNVNKDNDLLLPLEEYDKDAEWVIQRKCSPLSENTTYLFEEYTNATWQELCDFTHSMRKMVWAHNKKGKPIYTIYVGESVFLKKFEKFLIDNNIDYFEDFRDPINWGVLNGKIYLIDYGMDSITIKKYNGRL